jgi:hypothetical protein
MEIKMFINTIFAITIFGVLLFLYSNLSLMVQTFFNKNLNEKEFRIKWQMDSYASYTLLFIGAVNFFNEFFIKNASADFCINIVIMIGSVWYMEMLIKHYFDVKSA